MVGHVNPNRVALLRDLASLYPELELVASNAGAKLLGELWSQRKPAPPGQESEQPEIPDLPAIQVIRLEQTLSLSHRHQLQHKLPHDRPLTVNLRLHRSRFAP